MSMRNADYNDDTTPRGPSNGLWHSPALPCPMQRIRDEMIGIRMWDDFTTFDSTDLWVVTQASTGTATLDDAAGGVLLVDCNSTTNEYGINVQRAGGATVGEIFIPAAGRHLWFEARVKVADIGTNTAPEMFIGLATIDTTVIASGANSTDNHIGFETTSGAEELLAYGEKATARSTPSGTSHTIVDGTWFKIGFSIEGVTAAKFYVDGVHDADEDLATANIPIVAMVPTIVCQSNGTVDPIIHVDWMVCAQLTEVTP